MANRRAIVYAMAALIGLLGALAQVPGAAAAPVPTYTLSTEVQGEGAVVPPRGSFPRDTFVVLRAVPRQGWTFDHWEGSLSGIANPANLRIRANTNIIAVFVPTGGSAPTPVSPTSASPTAAPPEGKQIVGYFTHWSLYQPNNYYVKDIVTSGSADKLTVINYAFAGIGEDLKCSLIDSWAAYARPFLAEESVDGQGDLIGQPLKGTFNQLRKLKRMYPHLKVLISIGGWLHSERFSDAALPNNRAAFVNSCIDMFIGGNFAPGVGAPGIFDGFDLDWEYPGVCGATCAFRPEDRENFTALLTEFRNQLDAAKPGLLLTITGTATEYFYSQLELGQVHHPVNWINLLTYNYHGPWEPEGPTNHRAPLYTSPADPGDKYSVDTTVRTYLEFGVPAKKLVLGVPFYGYGWAGVPAGTNNGLYQSASGFPPGKYEPGTQDYEALEALGYPSFWDPVAQAQWIYNGDAFWSYDNAASVAAKMDYVKKQGLLGAMFWELTGDDPQGTLITAIADGLR